MASRNISIGSEANERPTGAEKPRPVGRQAYAMLSRRLFFSDTDIHSFFCLIEILENTSIDLS